MAKKRKVKIYVVRSDAGFGWEWHCWIWRVICSKNYIYTSKRNATVGARNWAKSTLAPNIEVEICYG